jgi:hypothetical protein
LNVPVVVLRVMVVVIDEVSYSEVCSSVIDVVKLSVNDENLSSICLTIMNVVLLRHDYDTDFLFKSTIRFLSKYF